MNCWMNTTVGLNDSWGLGATDILKNPLNLQAEFTLRPRYLRDSQSTLRCAHFNVDFASGYMPDGWKGVSFTPMGNTPVTGIYGLPPWDPSQSVVYRKMIDGAVMSLGDARTMRLEGVIPYLDATGAVGYDTVRLFYVFNAVQGSASPDLVVVKTASLIGIPGTVQARQDGSGQGPPQHP